MILKSKLLFSDNNRRSTTLKLMDIFYLSKMLFNHYAISLHSKKGDIMSKFAPNELTRNILYLILSLSLLGVTNKVKCPKW